MDEKLPPNFTTWKRENLDALAFDLWSENRRLREEILVWRDAYRREVARNLEKKQ